MKICVLSENTAVSDTFGCEHGLSLYLETEGKKLLFDTGASDLFARNAEKMGIDLAEIDAVVISHGHDDHGGGLHTFFERNTKAKVYVQKGAFGARYVTEVDGSVVSIGLEEELRASDRLVFCEGDTEVMEGLTLFSVPGGGSFSPPGNSVLWQEKDGALVLDDFSHEQNLMLDTEGKRLLLSGCAHTGILHILQAYEKRRGSLPDIVIGGLHLYDLERYTENTGETLQALGRALMDTGATFYTCHCTGLPAFSALQSVMGDRMAYLSAGSEWIL